MTTAVVIGLFAVHLGSPRAFLIPMTLLAIPLTDHFWGVLQQTVLRLNTPGFFTLEASGDRIPEQAIVALSLLLGGSNIAHACAALSESLGNNRGAISVVYVLIDVPDGDSAELTAAEEAQVADATSRIHSYFQERNVDVIVLCRPRVYDRSQRAYIARDRKRGKIEDLVAALVRSEGPYTHTVKKPESDFLILLDEGSVLAPGAARLLIDTLRSGGYGAAAPAVFSPTISSPRRGDHLAGSLTHELPVRAGVPWMMSSFGETFFVGQGAVRLTSYADAVLYRLPGSRILSHDKLEGFLLKTAASPGILLDSPPSTRLGRKRARERWTRGDFQLIPFIFGRRSSQQLGLTLFSRWMLANDLLRGLQQFSAASLLIGCVILDMPLMALLVLALANVDAVAYFIKGPSRVWSACFRAVVFTTELLDSGLTNLAGALRGVLRLITGRALLQWTPSAVANSAGSSTLRLYRYSTPSVLTALGLGATSISLHGLTAWLALPVVWVAAPFLSAYWDRPVRSNSL